MTDHQAKPRGRVLMAGPSDGAPGGMLAVVESYVTHWDSARYDLRYVGTYTDQGNRLTSVWFMVRALARCLWLLLSWRPDIVHVHVSQNLSVVRKGTVALMGRLFGTKVVWHAHGSHFDDYYEKLSRPSRAIVRWVMGQCERLITLTEHERQYYQVLVPEANGVILPNAYQPFAAAASSPPSQRAAIALTMGRLGQRKGTYDIFGIVPDVIAACPNAVFVVAGDGDVETFRRMVRDAGLAEHFQAPGWLDGAEREAQFGAARVFLLPSYAESFGIAVIEAMARGLPVITTPTGVSAEIIDDGVNGFLIQPGNRAALAERVIELLTNDELADRLGARGRETVIDRFSITSVMDDLYAIYDSL